MVVVTLPAKPTELFPFPENHTSIVWELGARGLFLELVLAVQPLMLLQLSSLRSQLSVIIPCGELETPLTDKNDKFLCVQSRVSR